MTCYNPVQDWNVIVLIEKYNCEGNIYVLTFNWGLSLSIQYCSLASLYAVSNLNPVSIPKIVKLLMLWFGKLKCLETGVFISCFSLSCVLKTCDSLICNLLFPCFSRLCITNLFFLSVYVPSLCFLMCWSVPFLNVSNVF